MKKLILTAILFIGVANAGTNIVLESNETIGLEYTIGNGVVGVSVGEDKLLFTMGATKKFKRVDVTGMIEVGKLTTTSSSSRTVDVTTTKTTCKKLHPAQNGPKKGTCLKYETNTTVTPTTTATASERNRVSGGVTLQISKDLKNITPFLNLKARTLNGGLSSEEEVTIGLKIKF